MKTLKALIKQKPVYLNAWTSKIDLISDFDGLYISDSVYKSLHPGAPKKQQMDAVLKEWQPIRILFATYGQGNYEGDAFVLFERDGKLFEVNAGHCSCYGLENGGWSPEETTVEAIAHRLEKGRMGQGSYCNNEYYEELKQFLGIK